MAAMNEPVVDACWLPNGRVAAITTTGQVLVVDSQTGAHQVVHSESAGSLSAVTLVRNSIVVALAVVPSTLH